MKTLLIITSLIFSGLNAVAQEIASPLRVPVEYGKLYIPNGFDSNDVVQVVGEGYFPNTCYRPATGSINIDNETRKITLTPMAYQYAEMCLQVILPYENVINVGLLSPGLWEIIQGTEGKKVGAVQIKPANKGSADDFLYAPVSQAFFEGNGASNRVILTGPFGNSCMSLEKVLVNIENDVIILQPIAQMTSTENCQKGNFPFRKEVELPSMPVGRYLLHIRSMNGKAVNTLVDVGPSNAKSISDSAYQIQ